jgi:hypothetical protein
MLMNWNKNIGVSFYNYESDVGEANAIFTTSRLPGIAGESEKDDTINDQLADLNRKVCQDAVKVKNMPNKMQTFYTFLDNPHLDGENDHIRSKAEKTKYKVKVPEIQLKEINDQFEREGKRAMNDIKGEINFPDGRREFLFDYGEVDSG